MYSRNVSFRYRRGAEGQMISQFLFSPHLGTSRRGRQCPSWEHNPSSRIDQCSSSCASLRNSLWRLLLDHFGLRRSRCATERVRVFCAPTPLVWRRRRRPILRRSDPKKTSLCGIYSVWVNSVFASVAENALITFESKKERPVNSMCVSLADGAIPNRI